MKQITAEDVRLLQKESGEGMMTCRKILVERYKAEEKEEIENLLWSLDMDSDLRKVLEYLVRQS